MDKFFNHFNITKADLIKDRVYVSDDEMQDVYDIDTMDLQIWVDDHNNIVTVII